MRGRETAELLLRIALAFSFFYVAVSSFLAPSSWIGFFPSWVTSLAAPVLSPSQVLGAFSVAELGLVLWLLSGFYLRWAAGLSVLLLAGIVSFNMGAMEIVFRDVSLALSAVALMVLTFDKQN